MQTYLNMLKKILKEGEWVDNRTGVRTKKVTGIMFEHDMSTGFPLLTTKKMYHKSGMVELEGFIKGITDKRWYQKYGCHFWDDWCNPTKVPYSTDNETKAKMKAENDLGPIYGHQWRSYNQPTHEKDLIDGDIDQLKNIIGTLRTNPLDRRMICNAWNPAQLPEMALPPCHLLFQVLSNGIDVDLIWYQRSCDMFLGVPYNLASYAMLLTLIAATVKMRPRKLIGILADAHVYENHMDQVKEQLSRTPDKLPTMELFSNDIFDWTHKLYNIHGYTCHPPIKAPIAV